MNPLPRGLTYMRPYLWWASGAFLSMLIVTALGLVTPQLISSLIDDGIQASNWDGVLLALGGLLLVVVLRGLFSVTNAYGSETASQGVAFDLRRD